MKLLISLFLAACVSFGAQPNATAGDEDLTLLMKRFQEASDKYPSFKDAGLLHEELRRAVEEYSDQTKGKSGICPVHKIKMSAKEVPFRFGLLAGFGKFKEIEFPFSDEFIWGGCGDDGGWLYPKTGKVFVCPQCVAARNRRAVIEKKMLEKSKSK